MSRELTPSDVLLHSFADIMHEEGSRWRQSSTLEMQALAKTFGDCFDAVADRLGSVESKLKNVQEASSYSRTKLMQLGQDRAAEPFDQAAAIVKACIVAARCEGGIVQDREATARAFYAQEGGRMLAAIVKALATPMQTGDSGMAGILGQTYTDTIAMLAPASAYAALTRRPSALAVPLSGNATAALPNATLRLDVDPFHAEGQPIAVVMPATFGRAILAPHVVALIATLTGEMKRYSLPAAEVTVGDCLRRAVGLGIDRALFDAQPGDARRPASIINGVTPLVPSAAPSPMIADLTALLNAIPSLVDPVIFMPSASAVAASMNISLPLTRPPIIGTLALDPPSSPRAVCIDAADFAHQVGSIDSVDAATESVLVSRDDAVPVVTGGVAGTPMVELWQQDIIGLRLIGEASWIMRRAGRVSWIDGITW